MPNRLPGAAALVAALLTVPLGAGIAHATPATAPTASNADATATTATSVADSLARAKDLARSAHRSTSAGSPSTTRSSSAGTKLAGTQTLAGTPTSADAQALAAAPQTGRISGANRYETSVAVSRASYADQELAGGAMAVASGALFPDAVAGGPVSSGLGGPLLLVPPTGTLPTSVVTEIKRLGVSDIYIMGSEGAVSAGVASQLAKLAHVDRVFGANRYETAAYASAFSWTFSDTDPNADPTPPPVVYLASGTTFADSLSGSAAGSIVGAPLLLTSPTTLPDVVKFVLEDIKPVEVRILGSTAAVSATVASQVAQTVPTAKVTRLGGSDRFATAAAVANNLKLPTGGSLLLANGLNFPDALSAATASAVGAGPLLLVRQTCSPAPTTTQVTKLAPTLVTAIGSTAVVSNDALAGKAC